MQAIKVSPAEVERRVDDIFAAAIDRGLDAVARNELCNLDGEIAELAETVDRHARLFTETLVNLHNRITELEEVA